MRAHRGRTAPAVLLAGDAADLVDLRALIATLPSDAYGQVYVETGADDEAPAFVLPARVVASVLVRGEGDEPGDLLAAAVDGWIAEWLPEGHWNCQRIAWIGCAARPEIAARYRRLQDLAASAPALGLPAVGIDDQDQ